jgi:2-polyprenyl-3-methyl-5-hydroxy-6-metoxy-1,4-benzoquinol methylase
MKDSKALWLQVHSQLQKFNVCLGVATSQCYMLDPRSIAFIASRYKFVSKLLDGKQEVIEVGCGDAFGSPIVAESVGRLVCTDIDEGTLSDNLRRLSGFSNMSFSYFDFRSSPYFDKVDAVYCVDVLEHIFPNEEDDLITNISGSLNRDGVLLIGTPNVTAEKYASPNSVLGHVNLKDHKALKNLGKKYFENVFIFSMNDEVVHTGYYPMAHYLWALCVTPK